MQSLTRPGRWFVLLMGAALFAGDTVTVHNRTGLDLTVGQEVALQ